MNERLLYTGTTPMHSGGKDGGRGGSWGKGGRGQKLRQLWRQQEGLRSEDWLKAIPQLGTCGPLPHIVSAIAAAGEEGIEIGLLARKISPDSTLRIDLRRLKGYLCFPSTLALTQRLKPSFAKDGKDAEPYRVDVVALVASNAE